MLNHIAPLLSKEDEKRLDELGGELMEIERELAQEDDDPHLRKQALIMRAKMSALLRGEEFQMPKRGSWRMTHEQELLMIKKRQREEQEQHELCERMVGTRVTIIDKEGDEENEQEIATEAEVIQIIDNQVLLRKTWPQEFMLIAVWDFVERFEDDEIRINLQD